MKKADSPLCPACVLDEETLHHLLFDCPAYRSARHRISRTLGRKSKSLRDLLGKREPILEPLRFISETKHLKATFGDIAPYD